MDHYYEYALKHSTHEFDDCKSVIVSLKVDGTPLQMETDGDSVKFHSRGSSMTKPGPDITSVDLFMNPAFYPQVEFLKKAAEGQAEMYLQYVHLFNFEVIVENKHHIIQYDQKPSGNMFLLSATTKNDSLMTQKMLPQIAKSLGVESIPFVELENRDGLMEKIWQFSKNTRFYDNSGYIEDLDKKLGCKTLCREHMEGIVLKINGGRHDGMMLKIDSPEFKNEFSQRKDKKMTDRESSNISSVLECAKKHIDMSKLSKWSNDPLENLIVNFEKTIASDPSALQDFVNACKKAKPNLLPPTAAAIPQQYQSKSSDQAWLTGLHHFVWLFRKERKGLLSGATPIVKKIRGIS